MLRSALLATVGAGLLIAPPAWASGSTTVSRTGKSFKITMTSPRYRFRDPAREHRFHQRKRAAFARRLARILPHLNKALRRLGRKHRRVYRFGRYRPKLTLAREGAKGRLALYAGSPRRLAPKARGPYNYEISTGPFVQIWVTLRRLPSRKWRRKLTAACKQAVRKGLSP